MIVSVSWIAVLRMHPVFSQASRNGARFRHTACDTTLVVFGHVEETKGVVASSLMWENLMGPIKTILHLTDPSECSQAAFRVASARARDRRNLTSSLKAARMHRMPSDGNTRTSLQRAFAEVRSFNPSCAR